MVLLPREVTFLPKKTSTVVYSFTSPQCFAKSKCSSTVQRVSPSEGSAQLATCSVDSALSFQLCKRLFYLLQLPAEPCVCTQVPLFVPFLPLLEPLSLSGRFRPAPVLNDSDEGQTCWEPSCVLVASLLGVRQTWARGPGVPDANCVNLGKCLHRSECFFHHLKTGDVSDAAFPRWLRTTCDCPCTTPSRMLGARGVRPQ